MQTGGCWSALKTLILLIHASRTYFEELHRGGEGAWSISDHPLAGLERERLRAHQNDTR